MFFGGVYYLSQLTVLLLCEVTKSKLDIKDLLIMGVYKFSHFDSLALCVCVCYFKRVLILLVDVRKVQIVDFHSLIKTMTPPPSLITPSFLPTSFPLPLSLAPCSPSLPPT